MKRGNKRALKIDVRIVEARELCNVSTESIHSLILEEVVVGLASDSRNWVLVEY